MDYAVRNQTKRGGKRGKDKSYAFSAKCNAFSDRSKGEKKNIGGYDFLNYGSSCDDYKYLPYMTFSCAIGIKDEEIDGFVNKIDKIFEIFIKH